MVLALGRFSGGSSTVERLTVVFQHFIRSTGRPRDGYRIRSERIWFDSRPPDLLCWVVRRTWTDSQLRKAVKTSRTYLETFRKLGLRDRAGLSVRRRITELELDVSHFSKPGNREGPQPTISIQDILEGRVLRGSAYVKRRLLKEGLLIYKCDKCGLKDWQGKPITLQLDHKDGDRTNNALSNLRLLCPNCHSQTPTYCVGNRKLKKNTLYVCVECGVPVSTGCRTCADCRTNQPAKVDWPSRRDLHEMVRRLGPLATARRLEVSRNTLYGRLRKQGYYDDR